MEKSYLGEHNYYIDLFKSFVNNGINGEKLQNAKIDFFAVYPIIYKTPKQIYLIIFFKYL